MSNALMLVLWVLQAGATPNASSLLCVADAADGAAAQEISLHRAVPVDCLIDAADVPSNAKLVDTRSPGAHQALGLVGASHVPMQRLSHGLVQDRPTVLFGNGKDDAALVRRCLQLRGTQTGTLHVVRGGLRALADRRQIYGDAARWRDLWQLSALEFDALLTDDPDVRVLVVGSDDYVAAGVARERLRLLRRTPGERRLRRILRHSNDASWVIAATPEVSATLQAMVAQSGLDGVLFYSNGTAHLVEQRRERDAVIAARDWIPPSSCAVL